VGVTARNGAQPFAAREVGATPKTHEVDPGTAGNWFDAIANPPSYAWAGIGAVGTAAGTIVLGLLNRRPALEKLVNDQLRIVLAGDKALLDGSAATIKQLREEHAHLHRAYKELPHYVSALTNELVSAGVAIPPMREASRESDNTQVQPIRDGPNAMTAPNL
jgi:hypothetical protein